MTYTVTRLSNFKSEYKKNAWATLIFGFRIPTRAGGAAAVAVAVFVVVVVFAAAAFAGDGGIVARFSRRHRHLPGAAPPARVGVTASAPRRRHIGPARRPGRARVHAGFNRRRQRRGEGGFSVFKSIYLTHHTF